MCFVIRPRKEVQFLSENVTLATDFYFICSFAYFLLLMGSVTFGVLNLFIFQNIYCCLENTFDYFN